MAMRPLALLLFATMTTAAFAQAGLESRAMTVDASVPGFCAVGPAQLAEGAMVNFRGLNGNALQIDALVDPATMSTQGASVGLRLDAQCSIPHRLRIETQNNGLWQTLEQSREAADGFASAVPYRAIVRWGAETVTMNADAQVRRISESSIAVATSVVGDILLRLEIDPGATNASTNAPLLAGHYGDSLRITLEPRQ